MSSPRARSSAALRSIVAHLASVVATRMPPPHAHLEIGAELAGQHRPHLDRAAHQQPTRRREGARPGVALFARRAVRDLRVQAAGIGARGERVEVAALDQRHADAVVGQVIGGRAAGQAAADHDHVGPEGRSIPQALFAPVVRCGTFVVYKQNSVRHTLSIPTREQAPRPDRVIRFEQAGFRPDTLSQECPCLAARR